MRRLKVALVIPAFRESARLPVFGAALVERLAEFGGEVELWVVDDGSGEREARVLGGLVESLRAGKQWVRPPIYCTENRGKGAAVYTGWKAALAASPAPEWVGFCDADGSVNADEIVRLIRKLDTLTASASALIASREAPGARSDDRSVARALLGRAFAAWVRIWLGGDSRDTQCGCKFVRTARYREARAGLSLRRYAFDAELLVALSERGGQIVEEGVAWRHTPGGALRVWRDGPAMLISVVVAAVRALSRRRES